MLFFPELGKWGRTLKGSDGLTGLPFKLCRVTPLCHNDFREFDQILTGQKLVKNCLTPSSADHSYPVPTEFPGTRK